MTEFIDDDFVALRDDDGDIMMMLAFGDEIEVLDDSADPISVRAVDRSDGTATGFIDGDAARRPDRILKFSMVDVQQGDGMVLETPGGKIILIDGGDVPLFARHVAARFLHKAPTVDNPLEVDAIVVTHGDADHFDGLNDIRRSEDKFKLGHKKRLAMHPKRLFTNGLVKLKDNRSDDERLGATVEDGGDLYVVDLFDDPRDAEEDDVNQTNKWFATSLDHWEQDRDPILCQRVDASMDPSDLFDFLDGDVEVEVLGPFVDMVPDGTGADVPGLKFLPRPPKSPEVHLSSGGDGSGRSMSHTINGHSIVLRVTYGNVRIVLTGDMNTPAMRMMDDRLPSGSLVGEFVKAPHHGSHEFDLAALRKMKPVVAAISSGDENEFKEHIHPRATLLAGLGQSIEGDVGAIFCTELAAFFKYENECYQRSDLADFFGDKPEDEVFTAEELRKLFSGVPRAEDPPGMFHGFRRTNFGIINLRTDGDRMLVFTYSGEKHVHEAYRFRIGRDAAGDRTVDFETVTTA